MAGDTAISRLTDTRDDLPESVSDPARRVLTIAALAGLLEQGDAVTALPALASPEYLNPSLVYRDLVDPVIDRELCLIRLRKRPLSGPASAFYDYISAEMPRFCQAFEGHRIAPVASKS
jgi:DNA-binding transcriptional LysR family regulator